MAYIFGFFLFLIFVFITKSLFQLLSSILKFLLSDEKLTLQIFKNYVSAILLSIAIFICIGGLFYFTNDENGHLSWHILLFDIFFILFIQVADGIMDSKKEDKIISIIGIFPFIWALYSGFAATVFDIANQLL
ncbi:hypothetical protein AB4140_16275 [Shewanella sp. 10N.286.51.B2]|uniref:hypothetical protein n=1 Tax=Shewanella sp. 10N.286.51.B2 TaxID=3229707 RepID=UPI003550E9C4